MLGLLRRNCGRWGFETKSGPGQYVVWYLDAERFKCTLIGMASYENDRHRSCATGYASSESYQQQMPTTPHRKRVRHYEGNGHLHELTFSCYQRRPLLTNDVWRGILADRLRAACEIECFQLVAFVFMPEHVHLLTLPRNNDAKVSRLFARTKQPTSKSIKQLLETRGSALLDDLTVRERPGKHCFRFWQEGPGYDRNIFSPQAIEASIEYIHQNPVRRNLCQRSTEWKWSSARYYATSEFDPNLPPIVRPQPHWFDSAGIVHEHG